MAFYFRQGDRPLAGYTIQRGVGRGGFGEVYYATSDGGKEVALKYLRDNPQVELRGVAHCLNLKSPHLVAVHDIKQNPDGEWFVVMEYVNGPSLRDLLNSEPGGLGPQKAAYFLREIGKGLAYLHDRGIVHRDLKPGNIFYEDGYVKIGDYGLAKIMAASQHSGQTVSVGTVHYMAPEVGSGNYDRTIDIYALGVILYEMLLGRVPFTGATMGEVLMKHLTAQPQVDELPAPFPRVIRKALEKDPKDRYATVQEMVNEVFAIEDLDRSVAAFEPASLSTLAARATRQATVALAGVGAAPGEARCGPLGTGSSNTDLGAPPPPAINPGVTVTRAGGRFGRLHDRINAKVDAVTGRIDGTPAARELSQAVGRRGRWFEHVAAALLIVVGLSWGSTLVNGERPAYASNVLVFTLAVVSGVAAGSWLSLSRWKLSGKWGPRLITAICTGVAILPAYGVMAHRMGMIHGEGADSWARALLVTMILCDWPGRFLEGRRGKVSLGSAFSVGVFGFICGAVFGAPNPLGVAAICAASSLAVQAVAAIWPLPRQEDGGTTDSNGGCLAAVEADDGSATHAAPGVAVNPLDDVVGTPAITPPPVVATAAGRSAVPPSKGEERQLRSVVARALWLATAAALLCTSIMLFVAAGMLDLPNKEEFGTYIMGGVAMSCYFLFAVSCALRRYKAGLWRTLFRPLVFFSGLAAAGCAGTAMGLMPMSNDDKLAAIGMIIGGAIVSLFVWLVPVPRYIPTPATTNSEAASERRRTGNRLMIVGGILLGVMVIVAPIIAVSVDESDLDAVMPAVAGPLSIAGIGFVIGGLVLRRSTPRAGAQEPRSLPLRLVFDVDARANLPALIERHWTMLGYALVQKSDLLWSFVRGDWLAHLWDKDAHHWKTQVNIAAYELERGYRLTCYLDVHSPFKRPRQQLISALYAELCELQQLLDGRDVPPTFREERP